MKDGYKVIVFDLGNTLISFDHSIAARKVLNLFHTLDLKKLYDTFFDSEITSVFEKGLISPKEFHKRMQEFLGIKLPYADFVPIWNEIFWEDKGSCYLARRLRSRYKLFLLSNVNRLHFEYIRKKFDIISIFDELILSFMLGAMKPDRLMFDEAVKRAGGDAGRLLYIDDRKEFVKEAGLLGIDSIKYDGAEDLAVKLMERGILLRQ
ncbi:MAG: HAD hydrolase-like protein [Candidatus Omnitrophica bacterium]|nr:HAD hydrolase-like protein [Candidatus Omnitrophota bacterium]